MKNIMIMLMCMFAITFADGIYDSFKMADVVDGVVIATSVRVYEYGDNKDTTLVWSIVNVEGSCGYKIKGKRYNDIQLVGNGEEELDSLIVFRACEGTLLFAGVVEDIGRVEDGLPKHLYVNGHCFDKTGMNKIKYVNNLSKCK